VLVGPSGRARDRVIGVRRRPLPGGRGPPALTCLAIPFKSEAATMCSVATGTGIPFASLDELVERGMLTARYNTTTESVKEEQT